MTTPPGDGDVGDAGRDGHANASRSRRIRDLGPSVHIFRIQPHPVVRDPRSCAIATASPVAASWITMPKPSTRGRYADQDRIGGQGKHPATAAATASNNAATDA